MHYLLILCDLSMCGGVAVEELAFEGEDAVVVAASHGQVGHSQRLGVVPLNDSEGAVLQPGVALLMLSSLVMPMSLVYFILILRLRNQFEILIRELNR